MNTSAKFLRSTPWRCAGPSTLNSRHKSTTTQSSSASPLHGNGQFINIVEVGPRDGLQNISGGPVPTDTKLELIRRLFQSGVKVMEVGSFVRADRVPQMADTPQLLPRVRDMPEAKGKGIHLPVLVPNMRGLDNLLKLEEEHSVGGADRLTDEVSVFVPVSDDFCKANNGTTVQALLDSIPAVISKAIKHGYRVRGYASVVMSDPYSGPVPEEAVTKVTAALDHMGCYEMSLGDTTGEGDPLRWISLWEALKREGIDMGKVAVHAHDTFSSSLASILALLPLGLRTIDSSVAGLGGCPYSPGATGNVATEDVVRLLHSMGYTTGINLDTLAETGDWISKELGRSNGSNVGTAMSARKRARAAKADTQARL